MSLVSWRQSVDNSNPNVDLVISVEPSSDSSARKFKVETAGNVLTVSANGAPIVTWTLFDVVAPEVDFETKGNELHVTLTKRSLEGWKSALRTPLDDKCTLLLSKEQLDAMLKTEMKSFIDSLQAPEDDPDKLLEAVLAERDGEKPNMSTLPHVTKWTEKHHKMVVSELGSINKKELEVVKQIEELQHEEDEKHAEKKEALQETLECVKIMKQCCEHILELKTKGNWTVEEVLEIIRLDLVKASVNSGDDSEDTEEYGPGEEEMSPESLYVNGIMALNQREVHAALHFLRLAAIRKNHLESTMTLVRLYMESGHQVASLRLLLGKARNDLSPLPNFTCAQMFENGVTTFYPSVALALYFYQRAATQGETSAMCFMSKIFERGGCQVSHPSPAIQDKAKATAWLQLALERGSLLSYKIMLEHYLEAGEYAQAKKYHAFLYDTSRELLKSVENVEARLDQLRRPTTSGSLSTTGGPTLVSRAPPTSTSAHADNTVATRSNAEQRLQKFEDRSGGRVAQGVARSSREASSGERSRKAWERRTKLFVVAGAVYLLAFPLRVLALPTVAGLLEGLTGSFSQRQSKPKGLF